MVEVCWVYIIESKEGFRYTGSTVDLKKRLDAHNKGISFWTKRGTAWKVIHQEKYPSRLEAKKRELFLKTGKGREELACILKSSLHRGP